MVVKFRVSRDTDWVSRTKLCNLTLNIKTSLVRILLWDFPLKLCSRSLHSWSMNTRAWKTWSNIRSQTCSRSIEHLNAQCYSSIEQICSRSRGAVCIQNMLLEHIGLGKVLGIIHGLGAAAPEAFWGKILQKLSGHITQAPSFNKTCAQFCLLGTSNCRSCPNELYGGFDKHSHLYIQGFILRVKVHILICWYHWWWCISTSKHGGKYFNSYSI